VGAKVNSKIVPLDYKLRNADIVDIITSKHGTPSLDWLKVTKAPHTKNKIRQWFKRERREENVMRGREMLERELKKHRLEHTMSDASLFTEVAKKTNFLSYEDLLASIGYGESNVTNVLMKLRDLLPKSMAEEVLPPARKKASKKKQDQAVRVKGIDNVLVRFSKCCTPVPGDDVIGFITLGKGVSVHRKDCPNFAYLAENPERFIEVTWSSQNVEPVYFVEIEVDALDRAGLLSDVMKVINENDIPARSCKAVAKKNRALIKIGLDIAHRDQLEQLMKKIRKVKNIIDVSRVTHLLHA
jgi:GTP pyrophosphokinase